jgi:hypothetical protein
MKDFRQVLRNMSDSDRCKHPPCTCRVEPGTSYCSPQCEAMEDTPGIDCRCGHASCKGRAH